MEEQKRRELYTTKVSAGSRVYFFDIKESREGKKYLTISEKNAKNERNRIMVFEENVQEFQAEFEKSVGYLLRHRK